MDVWLDVVSLLSSGVSAVIGGYIYITQIDRYLGPFIEIPGSDAATGVYNFLPGESSRQRQWRLWGVWRQRGGQRQRAGERFSSNAWYNRWLKKPLGQLFKEAVSLA